MIARPLFRVRFLGGAGQIGASCLAADFDDLRIVVDCGVRVQGDPAERLPDLALLEDGPVPAAILVTHAHLDHIGALPLLHQRFPGVPLYATAPTRDLMRVQLLDALRIMSSDSEREGEVPLYSRATVESLLARTVPVVPEGSFEVAPGGPRATFFPSGHILGACAIGIESGAGRVLFTGDISVDNQRTIPGMALPRFRPHLTVCESTYGNRLHASRRAEEERLLGRVVETIARGGKVLVPAFAIGRAQEVILILLRAMRGGKIPRFPVHVDGLVRRVCEVYRGHPAYLTPSLRRAVKRYGDPFFDVIDEVRPVTDPGARGQIVSGEPCAIVASSGMLTGGASAHYAVALLEDPASVIAITGYQDEEAPGRHLLEVAAGSQDRLVIGGQEYPVRCGVEKYALSAHADGSQIAALLGGLRASDTLLVHGDAAARRELAALLVRERRGRIHLPADGEERRFYLGSGEVTPGRRLRRTGIGRERPAEEMEALLGAHLSAEYPPGTSFSVRELHRIWSGLDPAVPEEEAAFEGRLRECATLASDPARPFLFRAVEEPEAPAEEGPLKPNRMVERIDEGLPESARLLRRSFQASVPHMVLHFAFPDRAREEYGALLEEVFEGTGWTWEIHPNPNLAELSREIEERVPDRRLLAKNPSVRLEERHVTLWLREELPQSATAAWSDACAALKAETGFDIALDVRRETGRAKVLRDAQGRVEINLSYRRIDEVFEEARHRPHRKGKHPGSGGEGPRIVLSFITPEVGERYRERMVALEEELGWSIDLSPAPNQHAIVETARRLLAGVSDISRGPSYVPADRAVRVVLAAPLEAGVRESVAAEFEDETGWNLIFQ